MNACGWSLELCFLAALCLAAMFLICAFSRNSTTKSSLMCKLSSLSFLLKFSRLREGSRISTGIMASAPYTKLNEDSFMDSGVNL